MRALVLLLMMGCGHAPTTQPTAAGGFFEGLGSHKRKITTSQAEAQRFFDQGLAFLFAFNHDEAIRSFTRAAELDPECAMAHWGVALANGPHINNPMLDAAHAQAAFQALERAQKAPHASPVEKELIEALSKRYAWPPPPDRKPLDQAYAEAMKTVFAAHPDDTDAGALYAEALMDLRPWDLWTLDGKPQPETPEIIKMLERVLAVDDSHPLGNHLYIHAVEASKNPERADGPADKLRELEPGLGHLVHMPSHIDVRRGRWKQAVTANQKAIEADRKYSAASPKQGFYRLYMAHNRQMLAWAAIMRGQGKLAREAIHQAVEAIPPEWIKENAALIDGFIVMPLEVELRFGNWDEVLAQPDYPDYLPLSRAMRHFARGVAQAAKGELAEARLERTAFLEAKKKVAPDATFGNNQAADLLAVAELLLGGEILIRDPGPEAGLEDLQKAVQAEDKLRYDEPPDWIMPARHALGATLLKLGRAADAEAVYREDLVRLPENGWSLFGLQRSLELQKKQARDVAERFRKTWEQSDTPLTSSCMCVPGV